MSVNRTFEALAHPRRREVLRLLGDRGCLSAGEIADRLDMRKPTLSGHLNVLKGANLVVGERSGTTIWYRVNLTVMEDVLHGILHLLGRGAPEEPGAESPIGHRIVDGTPVHRISGMDPEEARRRNRDKETA
ncbi:metalloregulator ArsR/SmtB family transcription factor [Streptomonospora salina]|uniref:DNA-binding transcriptional ArsR family regulator n=1 Tax=Streptomonospora salina TaxID=104205 RepID=A0A841EI34_9ACTN|nr:metalloregulator ArsR/SmtB family transcription factor [Streptomonospora salina]MBB6000478.1 DNA-binding transcriptional ArsR family regulator [Streptomonospora salina]